MKKRKIKNIILDVKDLKKTFGNNIILNNINFNLLEGESLAIIGASGSGKSVLLKNIIGLLEPDTGSIKINSTEMVNLPRRDKENLLLKMLILYKNDLMPRELALTKIWRDDNYFTSRSMDVYIAKLRKYLKNDESVEIINIHGEGFRLVTN